MNEQEYSEAVARLKAAKERLDGYRMNFEKQGYSGDSLERLMNPLKSFYLQFQEEVESYERQNRKP